MCTVAVSVTGLPFIHVTWPSFQCSSLGWAGIGDCSIGVFWSKLLAHLDTETHISENAHLVIRTRPQIYIHMWRGGGGGGIARLMRTNASQITNINSWEHVAFHRGIPPFMKWRRILLKGRYGTTLVMLAKSFRYRNNIPNKLRITNHYTSLPT